MIFKWLFTFLAILWLYQTVKPWFAMPVSQTPPPPKAPELPKEDLPLPPSPEKKPGIGEYVDYEEIE